MPLRLLAGLLAALTLTTSARAADAVLAPAGVLRAAYLAGNPAQASRDPATGEVRGVAADLARELARRRGIPLQLTGRDNVQAVIAAVRDGRADIGFLANDPSRRGPIEFSQTYLRNPQTLAVPQGSRLQSLDDLKAPGVRIGVTRGDSIALHLARRYPNVRLVEIETNSVADTAAALRSGAVDGFGASRLRLMEAAALVPGARVLPGSLLGVPQAIIVPAGQPERLAAVDAFLDAVRADGFLQAAIDRAANGTEIEPAPAR